MIQQYNAVIAFEQLWNQKEGDWFISFRLTLHYPHCRMVNTISRKLQTKKKPPKKKRKVPKIFKNANPTVYGFSEARCRGSEVILVTITTAKSYQDTAQATINVWFYCSATQAIIASLSSLLKSSAAIISWSVDPSCPALFFAVLIHQFESFKEILPSWVNH